MREFDAVVGGFIEKNDHEPMGDELDDLVDKIQGRVTRAIERSLTLAEKIGSLFGTHDPDQFIAFATYRKVIVPALMDPDVDESFTLKLDKIDLVPHAIGQPSGGPPVFGPPIEVATKFAIDGRIVVRALPKPVVARPMPTFPLPTIPRPHGPVESDDCQCGGPGDAGPPHRQSAESAREHLIPRHVSLPGEQVRYAAR